MSLRSLLLGRARSFRQAGVGIVQLLRGEPNARIHAGVTLAVLALGGWLGLPRRDWALLVLAISGVLAAEAANTALEALADHVAPDRHPLVGRAKDVAAAGVLLAALGAAAAGVLVLGPALLARLG